MDIETQKAKIENEKQRSVEHNESKQKQIRKTNSTICWVQKQRGPEIFLFVAGLSDRRNLNFVNTFFEMCVDRESDSGK